MRDKWGCTPSLETERSYLIVPIAAREQEREERKRETKEYNEKTGEEGKDSIEEEDKESKEDKPYLEIKWG